MSLKTWSVPSLLFIIYWKSVMPQTLRVNVKQHPNKCSDFVSGLSCLMFSTCLHLQWLSHHILSNTWSPPSGSFWNTPTLIACSPEVSHSSTAGLSRGTGKGLWSRRTTNSHLTLTQKLIVFASQWIHCDPTTCHLFFVYCVLTLR